MERYDTAQIAIMIANYVPCRSCLYPCKDRGNKSKYKCEVHWKNILDLIAYSSEKEKKDALL